MDILIDDGTREYTLKNQFGQEIGRVHFRPADFSIIDRFSNLINGFSKLVAPLQGLSLKNDGTAAFDRDWETLKGVERNLKQKIGALFDLDDVETLFERRNAFSSIGGEFYCFRVLTALQSVVEAAVKEEAALSERRMARYLQDVPEVGADAGRTAANA